MNIRPYRPSDLNVLTELTIATFGPFYENHFRPLVREAIFLHQHGRWADDYRAQGASRVTLPFTLGSCKNPAAPAITPVPDYLDRRDVRPGPNLGL